MIAKYTGMAVLIIGITSVLLLVFLQTDRQSTNQAQVILLSDQQTLPDIENKVSESRLFFVDYDTCLDAFNDYKSKGARFSKFNHFICAAQVQNGLFSLITPFDSCKEIYVNSEGKGLPKELGTAYSMRDWPTCDPYFVNTNSINQ